MVTLTIDSQCAFQQAGNDISRRPTEGSKRAKYFKALKNRFFFKNKSQHHSAKKSALVRLHANFHVC